MKVMDGSLYESRFAWPASKKKSAPMQSNGVSCYTKDQVAYINGESFNRLFRLSYCVV